MRLQAGTRSMRIILRSVAALFAVLLFVQPLAAQIHLSAEPVPTGDVVGSDNLAKILSIGYSNLERWSEQLLNQCGVVDRVIEVLSSNGEISSVNSRNTSFVVGAGGFEGVTNPTFVGSFRDSGRNAVSAVDVAVISNVLGYVLSQGGTAHFSPNNPRAHDFPLEHVVVGFRGNLSGEEAKAFFDFLGTVDPALWSGPLAGFTQIDDAMLFLQPDTTRRRFVAGLSEAASRYPGARYETLNNNGRPTTATAGVAFPGNDWVAFPAGDQYLAQIDTPSQRLLRQLASLRRLHLEAVSELLDAIEDRRVRHFLDHQFSCPTAPIQGDNILD